MKRGTIVDAGAPTYHGLCPSCETLFPLAALLPGERIGNGRWAVNGHAVDLCPWCREDFESGKNGA